MPTKTKAKNAVKKPASRATIRKAVQTVKAKRAKRAERTHPVVAVLPPGFSLVDRDIVVRVPVVHRLYDIYTIMVSPGMITIGCKDFTTAQWRERGRDTIRIYNAGATDVRQEQMHAALMALCDFADQLPTIKGSVLP